MRSPAAILSLTFALALGCAADVDTDVGGEPGDEDSADLLEPNPDKPWCGPSIELLEAPWKLLTLHYDERGTLLGRTLVDRGRGLQEEIHYEYNDDGTLARVTQLGDPAAVLRDVMGEGSKVIDFEYEKGRRSTRVTSKADGTLFAEESYSYSPGATMPAGSRWVRASDGAEVNVRYDYVEEGSSITLTESFDSGSKNVSVFDTAHRGTMAESHVATPMPGMPLELVVGDAGLVKKWRYVYHTKDELAVLMKIVDVTEGKEILVGYDCD